MPRLQVSNFGQCIYNDVVAELYPIICLASSVRTTLNLQAESNHRGLWILKEIAPLLPCWNLVTIHPLLQLAPWECYCIPVNNLCSQTHHSPGQYPSIYTYTRCHLACKSFSLSFMCSMYAFSCGDILLKPVYYGTAIENIHDIIATLNIHGNIH